ncbi:MAG: DUF58 domain-containing protein [Cryobacterium sp.]
MAEHPGSVERLTRTVRAGAHLVASVITALGWSVLAVVAVAFLAGYTLGWSELVVVAWAGLVLLIAAGGYLLGRDAYVISVDMPVTRVSVGEPAAGTLQVRNPTRRPLPGIRIEVPVGEGIAVFSLGGLGRGAAFDDAFTVPTTRRGVLTVGPVRTVHADPIGLVRKERVWENSLDFFVHPRTLPIPSMSTGFVRDLEGNPTRNLTTDDVSFHALREYVPGDQRRSIHWKSTAKTGTYMVRQFEESRRSHLIVVLSIAAGDYNTDEEFELAVSVAGSLGVRAIRDSRTLSVVAGTRTGAPRTDAARSAARTDARRSFGRKARSRRRMPKLRQLSTITRSRLLDELSGVDRIDTAPTLLEVTGLTAESVPGLSVAFLVCGTGTSLTQLRAASARFPLGVEVVAVVCDPDAVPSLRRLAELSVLTIGLLEDLQKSLARGASA